MVHRGFSSGCTVTPRLNWPKVPTRVSDTVREKNWLGTLTTDEIGPANSCHTDAVALGIKAKYGVTNVSDTATPTRPRSESIAPRFRKGVEVVGTVGKRVSGSNVT